MKSGKLFQKSIILTEKKLALGRLIACGLKSLQEWPLASKSYMRCSEIISKIDPKSL